MPSFSKDNRPYDSRSDGYSRSEQRSLTANGGYLNLSGCGNTMNCNHPVVRNVILDCLRYWVSACHVDGFRFDLASILFRDKEGKPMMHSIFP